MKVLWFSPTPSLAESFLSNQPMNGGFVKSLEKAIQTKIDLFIAFYDCKEIAPFRHGQTEYYPIAKNKNIFYKLRSKIFNEIEPRNDIEKFKKIIDEVRPDLIHILGTERPFGLVQKFYDIPCVVSIQGNISVYKYKFFSGLSYKNILKHTTLKNWILLDSYINRYFKFKKQAKREKEIFKLTKNFIGRTHWDKRLVKVLSPHSNYFHNDEILKEEFYKDEWTNKLENNLNLFTTTGPDIYKGIETLIYCAHLLDLNNIEFSWRVAGIGSFDEIVNIARKSLNLKLSKNIQFLGRVNDENLKQFILDSTIYVGISHIENSPNSLCEALLLGIPCIATNAGGTSNFVEDRNNGLLIQDGDPFAMAGAIIELKENFNNAVVYGVNARKRALLIHDKEKIVNDLLQIYDIVIGKN